MLAAKALTVKLFAFQNVKERLDVRIVRALTRAVHARSDTPPLEFILDRISAVLHAPVCMKYETPLLPDTPPATWIARTGGHRAVPPLAEPEHPQYDSFVPHET